VLHQIEARERSAPLLAEVLRAAAAATRSRHLGALLTMSSRTATAGRYLDALVPVALRGPVDAAIASGSLGCQFRETSAA